MGNSCFNDVVDDLEVTHDHELGVGIGLNHGLGGPRQWLVRPRGRPYGPRPTLLLLSGDGLLCRLDGRSVLLFQW